MRWLVVFFAACFLVADVFCEDETIAWCYHDTLCDYKQWPAISPEFCNGSRQSPIDIVTADVTLDQNLDDFVFTNFNNRSIIENIANTGKTVRVGFKPGAGFSGGGLGEPYSSLQFHLHWGNLSTVPGSEHTVNGRQFPMEFHIVSIKSRFNGNTTLAINDPAGAAALGFFMEELPGTTGEPASWKTLTNYLKNITLQGETVNVLEEISLDDLLPGVNRSKYYRYNGSLTTPACFEAVVWTVFKESVKVSKDLIDMFSTMLRISNTTDSDIMVNVFRGVQPALPVTSREMDDININESDDASSTCVSLVLLALSLLLGSNILT